MANSSDSIVPLIGRILISPIFIWGGTTSIMAFSMMTGVVAAAHVPFPKVSLACAAAIEILGGLAILTGFQTKLAAWVVFLFLIPTTLLIHNFWAMHGAERMMHQDHFLKNLTIMGGLLILATHGAGRCSVDYARAPKA
jgi:putative oxidoreductase